MNRNPVKDGTKVTNSSRKKARRKIVTKKKPPMPPPRVKKTPEEKAEMWQKRYQALELRMAGATYRDIASRTGYKSASSAKKACDAAMSKLEIDAAKEVVALDLARLDEFTVRCTHDMRQNGNLNQIDRLLRIMEFRYRLLGVNDETVRQLQNEHGMTTPSITNKNTVMVIGAAPETEDEFIRKMMGAVGVNPDSAEAQQYFSEHRTSGEAKELPMLEGSANETKNQAADAKSLEEEDIVEAEILEDL